DVALEYRAQGNPALDFLNLEYAFAHFANGIAFPGQQIVNLPKSRVDDLCHTCSSVRRNRARAVPPFCAFLKSYAINMVLVRKRSRSAPGSMPGQLAAGFLYSSGD